MASLERVHRQLEAVPGDPTAGASAVLVFRARVAFVFPAGQREAGFALGLGELAGQQGEGLDQGLAVGDRHLPQAHLLAPGPLLRHLGVHLSLLGKVDLVP